MNHIHYKMYSAKGKLLAQEKIKPISHMNVDYQMRNVAIFRGCKTIGKAVNLHVTDKGRSIEWIDDGDNMHFVTHRYDKRIYAVEVRHLPDNVIEVMIKRGPGKVKIYRTTINSYGTRVLLDIIGMWVEQGRMRIAMPDEGFGILVVPTGAYYDTQTDG